MNLFDQQTDKPNPKKQIVDCFNRDFPVGTKVILRRDSGEIFTEVTGEAYLHGRTPVAHFRHVSGCYAIEGRVRLFRSQ
ncbi:MAG: hypothetical protein E6Q97_08050 [Desulfurellales bacterium]|nr:MAG: hypothetical protein E6Q97_08050 [Desulfurellales bacterium]